MSAGWHVLLIGNGRDIPGRLRRSRPDIAVTMMVRSDILGRVREAPDNWAVIGVPTTEPQRWVDLARMVHALHPVDAVANFGEKDQDKYALICTALGLPGPTPQTMEWIGDKTAMRRRLAEAGVDDTAARPVTGREDVLAFAAEQGYPVVLKPAGGAGSSGVTVIADEAAVPLALERARAAVEEGGSLTVEAFLDGPEWSVEGFSQGGRHVMASVTRKFKSEQHCIEYAHVVRAELDPGERAAIEAHVVEVLDALGVRDGVTHTEVIVTPRGPRVVETHLRPAGDELPEMLRDHYGIDLIDALVQAAAGREVLGTLQEQVVDAASVRDHIAISYAFPPQGGTVRAINGVEEATAMPGVQGLEVLVEVGDELPAVSADSDSRTVEVKATGATEEEALERAAAAAAAVVVEVVP